MYCISGTDGKRAFIEKDNASCRAVSYCGLYRARVVAAARAQRRADCRPLGDAADGLEARHLPVRRRVTIGRQQTAGGVAGAAGGAREGRRARNSGAAIAAGAIPIPRPAAADSRCRASGAKVSGRRVGKVGSIRGAACAAHTLRRSELQRRAGRRGPAIAARATPIPRTAAADSRCRAGAAKVGGRRTGKASSVRGAASPAHRAARGAPVGGLPGRASPLVPGIASVFGVHRAVVVQHKNVVAGVCRRAAIFIEYIIRSAQAGHRPEIAAAIDDLSCGRNACTVRRRCKDRRTAAQLQQYHNKQGNRSKRNLIFRNTD
jgi:hypothetical protein